MSAPANPVRVAFIERPAPPGCSALEMARLDPGIETIRGMADPFAARKLLEDTKPHVLVLDLEMDQMDGLLFLRILMAQAPLPVVVLSSLTPQGSWLGLDALEVGAVDVFVRSASAHIASGQQQTLANKLKAAARTTFRQPALKPPPRGEEPPPGGKTLILLGASTGGTEAIREILAQLPATLPPICIVQHIPSDFSGLFAERLNTFCQLSVKEATHGDVLKHGCVFVAPGDKHMTLAHNSAGKLIIKIRDGEKIMHHRPSIDLMFESAAAVAGSQAVAGLLTGMGRDGATGLLKLRKAGAKTFAQDEKTSIVYGMPKAAADIGGAEKILPLNEVAAYIIRACGARKAQEV